MKRVIKAAEQTVPGNMEEFLPWALEEPLSLADYEITNISSDGDDYIVDTKYTGSHEKDMMPVVHLRAKHVKDDEYSFEGKFEFPDVEITDESYYDDLEAFTHYWYDNSKYWSRIFKYSMSRSDYLDE